MRSPLASLRLTLLLSLSACTGAPPSGTADAGDAAQAANAPDASAVVDLDSGTPAPDASRPMDASSGPDGFGFDEAGFGGEDAALPVVDAGTPLDAAVEDGSAGALDAAAPGDAAPPADAAQQDGGVLDGSAGPTLVRVMTSNLTSGTNQSYDGDPLLQGPGGIRIIQALHPDVILMQEFNYDPNGDRTYTSAEIDALVEQVCSPGCHHYREPGTTGSIIANGVISRWPILAGGIWDDPTQTNREFAWAQIDLPGDRDLWAVSIHLSTTLAKRNDAAVALLGHIQANVPAGDFLVVGGDLNTDLPVEDSVTTLSAVVETTVFPVDQAGNPNTNTNRNLSDAIRQKIYDRVLPSPSLDAYRVPAVVGSGSYPTGFVMDTRVYSPISEVPPALVTDSEQNAMQHMGVIKDFLIPAQ